MTVTVAVKLVTFYALHHFHGWWRHVTFSDMVNTRVPTVLRVARHSRRTAYPAAATTPRRTNRRDHLRTAGFSEISPAASTVTRVVRLRSRT